MVEHPILLYASRADWFRIGSCTFAYRVEWFLGEHPLYPSLRFHCNRAVHPGHWLGWARPTCPQLVRAHPPVPLLQQRFRRLPPPRTAYERLGFSPCYSAIRGRHRHPAPRRRIASQPCPLPSLCSRPYHRLAPPRFRWSTLRSRPRRGTATRRSSRPHFARDQDPAGPRLSKNKTPPRHHLTALPSATAPSKTKTTPPHRYIALPPAHTLSKTLPSTRLAAFLSATSLLSTISPNRLPASRKPPWSLALLPVWLAGHPSSPHRPPRASRLRPLLVPRQV